MAKEIPEWDKANLEYHYEKHPASKKHKAHWNDLMGRDPALGPISIFKYEDESEAVIQKRWIHYQAVWLERYNVSTGDNWYRPRSNYYVDDRMVISITINDDNTNKERIKTCYDHHFFPEGYIKKSNRPPLGELQDRYWKDLKINEKSGKIKPGSLRVINDESK